MRKHVFYFNMLSYSLCRWCYYNCPHVSRSTQPLLPSGQSRTVACVRRSCVYVLRLILPLLSSSARPPVPSDSCQSAPRVHASGSILFILFVRFHTEGRSHTSLSPTGFFYSAAKSAGPSTLSPKIRIPFFLQPHSVLLHKRVLVKHCPALSVRKISADSSMWMSRALVLHGGVTLGWKYCSGFLTRAWATACCKHCWWRGPLSGARTPGAQARPCLSSAGSPWANHSTPLAAASSFAKGDNSAYLPRRIVLSWSEYKITKTEPGTCIQTLLFFHPPRSGL